MLREISGAAFKLDEFLQAKLGRPYHALLSVGLITEIVHSATEAVHKVEEVGKLSWSLVSIVMAFALLIHQIGAMSHRFEDRERRRRERGESPKT